MSDITAQEAVQFNADCKVVEAHIRDWLEVSPLTEESVMDIVTSHIVKQLFHRWFGFEDTPANIERTRSLRQMIKEFGNGAEETPLHLS